MLPDIHASSCPQLTELYRQVAELASKVPPKLSETREWALRGVCAFGRILCYLDEHDADNTDGQPPGNSPSSGAAS